jgi:hypothetical protein
MLGNRLTVGLIEEVKIDELVPFMAERSLLDRYRNRRGRSRSDHLYR